MTRATPKAHMSAVEMKDSGVEWLGEIPRHWVVKRLKYVASVRASNVDKTSKETETEISLLHSREIYYHEFLGSDIPFLDATATIQQIEMFELKKGDVVVTKDSVVRGRIAIPAYVQFECNGVLPDYLTAIIRSFPNLSNGRFLTRILASKPLLHQFVVAAQGVTISHLSQQKIGNVVLVVPPLAEQRAIAAYLDRETARIDRLIAQTEALNALLSEKRVALISQAVTKGLDPAAPLKDSGVAWLGEIPQHWEVKRLKRLLRFRDSERIPISADERGKLAKIYPYFGASGIIDYVDDFIFDQPLILVAEDGANLYSRSSPLAFLAEGKYWVNNHAHILEPLMGPISYWINLLATIEYDPWITGAAQPKLTMSNLGSIQLPVPPLHEQHAIADHLDRETAKIDALIAKNDDLIALLREKRTALISAAVTGKIDLRNEV